MIPVITFNNIFYPAFQAEGFAAQFCFPFAKKVCTGVGYDIGCGKQEWAFPGAIPIDAVFDEAWTATNLPDGQVDYIFSSHCLEHVDGWVDVLDYWTTKIKKGGVLFLYLPDYSQVYHRPFNNRKHKHIFRPEYIRDYLINTNKYINIFVSGIDLYNSFIAIAEKK